MLPLVLSAALWHTSTACAEANQEILQLLQRFCSTRKEKALHISAGLEQNWRGNQNLYNLHGLQGVVEVTGSPSALG